MLIIIRTISWFANIMSDALLIRALMSWFTRMTSNGIFHKVYEILYKFTEPIVAPCRNFMYKYFNTGMFDFSIVVAMVLVQLVARILIRILVMLI